MSKRRKIPPINLDGPRPMPPLPDMGRVGYAVLEWSRDQRSPTEALVFMLLLDDKPTLGLRLKTRGAVEQLIDTLERHALRVWGRR